MTFADWPSEDELRAALGALPAGWYTSADLLPTYNTWAKQNGRPEITTRNLGQAIRQQVRPQRHRRVHGNLSAWWLDADVWAHRDWFRSDT